TERAGLSRPAHDNGTADKARAMMTLNHGLSGYVCGRVAMPLLKRHAPLSERHLGWAFFLGALAPDVDILTKVLLGRGAYFSGAWYAHRHLSHS
ncbi:MAG: metal-dependent hydrolase, partial [Gammaproteobacteria bacterium]|nr:metal-dependent hydrolase [Gammaproteobacteria bacterium]NIR97057.1 metal-dependent hydrolase [Gammaproteobacteria bacterium]NIT62755.1 metal-dependent hydrolase [Gammaproteobacteria bacterium]NIV19714.1 hypothetical protein [Gammaproteobacteria bacterium]NIY31335.1 hypothetical protein [Gammaproteobacteria bacterium]